MRFRDLTDTSRSRRHSRSLIEGKSGGPEFDLDTPEGAKARQQIAEQDIADLKRKWREEDRPKAPSIIDMGDSTVYTGYSKPFFPLRATTLESIIATVSAAGTSDTSINQYKNETLLGTIVIPAGELISDPLELLIDFMADDYWQALVGQAGVGAAGLTLYGKFR